MSIFNGFKYVSKIRKENESIAQDILRKIKYIPSLNRTGVTGFIKKDNCKIIVLNKPYTPKELTQEYKKRIDHLRKYSKKQSYEEFVRMFYSKSRSVKGDEKKLNECYKEVKASRDELVSLLDNDIEFIKITVKNLPKYIKANRKDDEFVMTFEDYKTIRGKIIGQMREGIITESNMNDLLTILDKEQGFRFKNEVIQEKKESMIKKIHEDYDNGLYSESARDELIDRVEKRFVMEDTDGQEAPDTTPPVDDNSDASNADTEAEAKKDADDAEKVISNQIKKKMAEIDEKLADITEDIKDVRKKMEEDTENNHRETNREKIESLQKAKTKLEETREKLVTALYKALGKKKK